MHSLLRDFRLDNQVRDRNSCHGTDCGAGPAANCLGGSAGVFHGVANYKGYGLVEQQVDRMRKSIKQSGSG